MWQMPQSTTTELGSAAHASSGLANPRCSLQIIFSQPRPPFLQTSQLLISPRLVLLILHLRVALQCFALSWVLHLFPLPVKTCTFPLQSVGFVMLCSNPALRCALAINPLTSFWCSLSLLFLLIFSCSHFHHAACVLPFWMKPLFFTICSQQLTDPPTVVRVDSAFCLCLPHHVHRNLHCFFTALPLVPSLVPVPQPVLVHIAPFSTLKFLPSFLFTVIFSFSLLTSSLPYHLIIHDPVHRLSLPARFQPVSNHNIDPHVERAPQLQRRWNLFQLSPSPLLHQ